VDRWKQNRTETGPSWNDVQEWLRDLEQTWHRAAMVEYSLLPDVRGRTNYGLWVRVVLKDRGEPGHRGERAKGAKWPTSEHKTMPGLLLRLCVDLDVAMTEEMSKAERQSAF
jgi:hypothetical protein